MKRLLIIAMLMCSALAVAQSDTLRPSTSSGVLNGGNTYDNNLATSGTVDAAGIVDELDPAGWQTSSGTVSGFSAPLHTYTSVTLYYKCSISTYTGANGSGGSGSIIVSWTGGSGGMTCDGTQRTMSLPAAVATASVVATMQAQGQNDSGVAPDPGSATTYLYEMWIVGNYGGSPSVRKLVQVTSS